MTRNLTRVQEPVAARRLRNTAEPSGELSKGDVVTIGEAPLAVARAGWTRIRGAITEVRASQHGTHPLPAPSRFSSSGDGTAPSSPAQGATS